MSLESIRKRVATLFVDDKQYSIFEGVNIIGRDKKANISLNCRKLSKLHAQICVTNRNEHFIVDLNSLNGTRLKQIKLKPYEFYHLTDTEFILFVDTLATYKYLHTEVISSTVNTIMESLNDPNDTEDNSMSIENSQELHLSLNDAPTQLIDYDDSSTSVENSQQMLQSINHASTQLLINNVDTQILSMCDTQEINDTDFELNGSVFADNTSNSSMTLDNRKSTVSNTPTIVDDSLDGNSKDSINLDDDSDTDVDSEILAASLSTYSNAEPFSSVTNTTEVADDSEINADSSNIANAFISSTTVDNKKDTVSNTPTIVDDSLDGNSKDRINLDDDSDTDVDSEILAASLSTYSNTEPLSSVTNTAEVADESEINVDSSNIANAFISSTTVDNKKDTVSNTPTIVDDSLDGNSKDRINLDDDSDTDVDLKNLAATLHISSNTEPVNSITSTSEVKDESKIDSDSSDITSSEFELTNISNSQVPSINMDRVKNPIAKMFDEEDTQSTESDTVPEVVTVIENIDNVVTEVKANLTTVNEGVMNVVIETETFLTKAGKQLNSILTNIEPLLPNASPNLNNAVTKMETGSPKTQENVDKAITDTQVLVPTLKTNSDNVENAENDSVQDNVPVSPSVLKTVEYNNVQASKRKQALVQEEEEEEEEEEVNNQKKQRVSNNKKSLRNRSAQKKTENNSTKKTRINRSLNSESSTQTNSTEESDEQQKDVSSNVNLSKISSNTIKHRVAFTLIDSTHLEACVKKLSGIVVDSSQKCTVLVTDKINRSLKFLIAIGLGKPIVDPKWILASLEEKQFLDPWKFLLTDTEGEEKFGFSLKLSLDKANESNKLFDKYIVVLALKSQYDILKEIIETLGGKCMRRIPVNTSDAKIIVVGTKNEEYRYSKYRKHPSVRKLVTPEAIYSSVLKQELNFDEHLLH